MLDLERELLAETFTEFDMVYNSGPPLFNQLYVDTKLPWLLGENASSKKTMIQRMVDTYDKHKLGNKKEK